MNKYWTIGRISYLEITNDGKKTKMYIKISSIENMSINLKAESNNNEETAYNVFIENRNGIDLKKLESGKLLLIKVYDKISVENSNNLTPVFSDAYHNHSKVKVVINEKKEIISIALLENE